MPCDPSRSRTYTEHLTPPDIEASYRSPDGKPLFELMPPPPPREPMKAPEGMSQDDADALIDLIRNDAYVTGELDDVIAHQRARHPRPPIRRLPKFYGYALVCYVGDGHLSSTGFRYIALQPPTPLSVTDATFDRILAILERQRDSLPLEQRWNAAVIAYKQMCDDGQIRLYYGRDAENWQISPDRIDEIAADAKLCVNGIG